MPATTNLAGELLEQLAKVIHATRCGNSTSPILGSPFVSVCLRYPELALAQDEFGQYTFTPSAFQRSPHCKILMHKCSSDARQSKAMSER
jgi:hypothetical protein